MEVGGVEVDVGELDVVQAAGAERPDDLVEPAADAGHLGLLDPRRAPEGVDQVVHGAGRHAVDVGLHHHRVQRLVDPSARLQDGREEAALAQLGDAQLDVTGLGGQQPRSSTVAFSDPGIGAFVAGGADLFGRFDLDQLLQHQLHGVADQIDAFTGTERVQELGHDRLRQGHRCGISFVCSCWNTPRITPMAPPSGGPSTATSKPTVRLDRAARAVVMAWLGGR